MDAPVYPRQNRPAHKPESVWGQPDRGGGEGKASVIQPVFNSTRCADGRYAGGGGTGRLGSTSTSLGIASRQLRRLGPALLAGSGTQRCPTSHTRDLSGLQQAAHTCCKPKVCGWSSSRPYGSRFVGGARRHGSQDLQSDVDQHLGMQEGNKRGKGAAAAARVSASATWRRGADVVPPSAPKRCSEQLVVHWVPTLYVVYVEGRPSPRLPASLRLLSQG